MRTLEKDVWYEVAIGDGANFEGELFRFNYCDYLYGDDEDLTSTIATDQTYAQFGADGRWSAAATMDIDEATNLRDEDGKTTGVTFTQGSISRCKKDEKNKQLYYSMKTNLYCDETKSVPTDFDVTYADCLYTVTT